MSPKFRMLDNILWKEEEKERKENMDWQFEVYL